jgi:hypothetical protein
MMMMMPSTTSPPLMRCFLSTDTSKSCVAPPVNTDIAAAFQELCRQTTFDTLTGKATKSYDDDDAFDDIPTVDALLPFHGYFKVMRSTACNNRYFDHRGHTHHVKGTTGGLQSDGMEMTIYSLSQHPIIGHVLDRHRSARAVGFADDLTIYAALKKAHKVLVEMRQRLGEDAKLRYTWSSQKFTSPVSAENEPGNM